LVVYVLVLYCFLVEGVLMLQALQFPEFEAGTVWLVGAGPGDPGLLTLHALNALQHADVIVYDALVSNAILQLAPPHVARIFAGKRGGKPSAKQPDITKSLIAYAQEGQKVLRLKGGDPFVFGRGAEEAQALVAAGVTFRIVPGITAGIGGLAYAGIPATCRETNSIVTFLTGHDAAGDTPALNWEAIAKGSPVLVFYMAMRNLPEIRQHLLAHGRAPDEPVALVEKAATPAQKVVVTNLENVLADVQTHCIEPPVITVVGAVVALQESLQWAPCLAKIVPSAGDVSQGYAHAG
jgi:uroporphyrin-III C-methyltransferase